MLIKGHFVSTTDYVKCDGCTKCILICPFGARQIDKINNVPIVRTNCYGCGICRNICENKAITLVEKTKL